ncbi:MAG: membrane protein insertase YidC [Puniceicoccales bacterium]|jgi:YidC/Oxa1 family membrane protein insertase|nr:membrane protein insertase YidC [Puniceicoccales bacterium]
MDKKSLLIGVICICIAFGLMLKHNSQLRQNIVIPQIDSISEIKNSTADENPLADNIIPHSFEEIGTEIQETSKEKENNHLFENQQFVTLENDAIRVRFSTIGAGIQSVELKKYPAIRNEEKLFVFNENMPLPALVLAFGSVSKLLLANYEIYAHTPQSVTFRKIMKNGIIIEREYRLSTTDIPYVIASSQRFINQTNKNYDLDSVFVDLGSFPATPSDVMGDYLNFGYYDGNKAHFIKVNDFRAKSGFFGLGKMTAKNQISGEDKIVWGSVKNQFFAGVFTPKTPGCGFVAMPKEVFDSSSNTTNESVLGSIKLPVGRIDAGNTKIIEADFYVGPKDYVLLDRLGKDQDLVMQFGIFGFVSKLLLLLMKGIYTVIGNWGMTIIILTLIVKLLLWPLTTAQVRSSRKMSKLQAPLKKIKEKYRDSPQKLQSETLKLFRDNRVNPAAGCLPVFIQIPIFLGLYFMLRTTAEMRFASFLWIPDLSLPDTICKIGALPINILPLVMGASMVWQMNVMPSPSIDGTQKWVFKLMPVICLFFCYNFPSALVLYWTVQNLLTIAQQIILNRKNDDALLIEDLEINLKKKKELGGKNVRA